MTLFGRIMDQKCVKSVFRTVGYVIVYLGCSILAKAWFVDKNLVAVQGCV
jgi:hypothetical protein